MRLVRYTHPSARSITPATVFTRSPWRGLEGEIDRMFDEIISDFASPADRRFRVDLFEDDDNCHVRAELPGVSRDDIHVEMVEGYLTISATRTTSGPEDKERERLSLNRSISIPGDVQADKVTAAYENGMLTVTLPKREEAKPRKITVSVK